MIDINHEHEESHGCATCGGDIGEDDGKYVGCGVQGKWVPRCACGCLVWVKKTTDGR